MSFLKKADIYTFKSLSGASSTSLLSCLFTYSIGPRKKTIVFLEKMNDDYNSFPNLFSDLL